MTALIHANDLVDWRRRLHSEPELGFDVHDTAGFVAERLREFGIEVHAGVGKTGVVGVLRKGNGKGRIGLRADMDALPIHEENDFAHCSRRAGQMHACGHDGHTTMLLGAARALARDVDFNGEIVFIFQPAEEHGQGARAMIEDRLFERFPVDEVYAVHNMPRLPTGQFATRPGPIMASEDNFEIVLTGKGGHAAAPHMSSEVLVAACQLVTLMQTIVSRRADPLDQAVVSVTEILTDGGRNILPGRAVVRGDTRSYNDEMQALIETEMRRMAQGVAIAFGLTAEVSYTHEFAATVNTAAEAGHALGAAALVSGGSVAAETPPVMASEDFGLMLRHRPGAYVFLGNGEDGPPLHNAHYDFNDAILPLGAAFFVELVKQRLAAR
jgi:amidohydrolase